LAGAECHFLNILPTNFILRFCNRMRQKRSPISPKPVGATPLCQFLDELLPLNLAELSGDSDNAGFLRPYSTSTIT
jgi:hypothetical protein